MFWSQTALAQPSIRLHSTSRSKLSGSALFAASCPAPASQRRPRCADGRSRVVRPLPAGADPEGLGPFTTQIDSCCAYCPAQQGTRRKFQNLNRLAWCRTCPEVGSAPETYLLTTARCGRSECNERTWRANTAHASSFPDISLSTRPVMSARDAQRSISPAQV